MPVLIVSAIFALYGHLRSLAIGYTDEAAFVRAVMIFVASLLVLRLFGALIRAWRTRRREARLERSRAAPASSAQPAFPPRPEFVRDRSGSGGKDRAA